MRYVFTRYNEDDPDEISYRDVLHDDLAAPNTHVAISRARHYELFGMCVDVVLNADTYTWKLGGVVSIHQPWTLEIKPHNSVILP